MAKTIKICDGVMMTYKGESERLESPRDIWDAFGWDIDADPMAKACADKITSALICFGYCDLPDADGVNIHLEMIPVAH